MQRQAVLAIGMVVALLLAASPTSSSAGDTRMVFVPWKVLAPGVQPSSHSLLMLYWIPASAEQMRRSELIMSSTLAEYAGRCVAMYVIRADDQERIGALGPDIELPIAVLSDASGEIARVKHHKGNLRTTAVESMVRVEVRRREAAAERLLDAARTYAAAGNWAAAAEAYQDVVSKKCAFPRLARSAQRALKRIRSVE